MHASLNAVVGQISNVPGSLSTHLFWWLAAEMSVGERGSPICSRSGNKAPLPSHPKDIRGSQRAKKKPYTPVWAYSFVLPPLFNVIVSLYTKHVHLCYAGVCVYRIWLTKTVFSRWWYILAMFGRAPLSLYTANLIMLPGQIMCFLSGYLLVLNEITFYYC